MKWDWDWKQWTLAALIRGLKTFAQCFAASIGTGMVTVQEVDWLRAASVSFVAFVLSLLTSLGGLPEVPKQQEPELIEPPDDPDDEE